MQESPTRCGRLDRSADVIMIVDILKHDHEFVITNTLLQSLHII